MMGVFTEVPADRRIFFKAKLRNRFQMFPSTQHCPQKHAHATGLSYLPLANFRVAPLRPATGSPTGPVCCAPGSLARRRLVRVIHRHHICDLSARRPAILEAMARGALPLPPRRDRALALRAAAAASRACRAAVRCRRSRRRRRSDRRRPARRRRASSSRGGRRCSSGHPPGRTATTRPPPPRRTSSRSSSCSARSRRKRDSRDRRDRRDRRRRRRRRHHRRARGRCCWAAAHAAPSRSTSRERPRAARATNRP